MKLTNLAKPQFSLSRGCTKTGNHGKWSTIQKSMWSSGLYYSETNTRRRRSFCTRSRFRDQLPPPIGAVPHVRGRIGFFEFRVRTDGIGPDKNIATNRSASPPPRPPCRRTITFIAVIIIARVGRAPPPPPLSLTGPTQSAAGGTVRTRSIGLRR